MLGVFEGAPLVHMQNAREVELNMFCNERDVPSMIVDCFPQTSAKKPSSLSAERRPDPPQPKFVPQMLKKLAGMTDVVSSADTGTARMVR
eukprot:jgi/Tetstr1/443488/TSEL_031496.t1